MVRSLTLEGSGGRRFWSFLSGVGMIAASVLTIQHFFNANFPESIFRGSFCDINSFFNCNSSAYSSIAQFWGVPMGYFGIIVGGLVVLGALFPSAAFERTNKSLSLLNALGVVGLFVYSVFFLKSLCLLCSGYYLFSLLSFALFWIYGLAPAGGALRTVRAFLAPSIKHLVVYAAILLAGAYGFHQFYKAKQDAQLGGVATRVVKEYYSLAEVKTPSIVSPFWTAKATERFEDARIRVIEYVDFLCPDCLFLYKQLKQLKTEYKGKINIAFQFFPLDGKCNQVVPEKGNKHPGACDLSFIAAYDPAKFNQIHDEIFENFEKARNPEWRAQLARKRGVEAALTDQAVKDLVLQIINTGAEYDKTSDQFAHGIRSTPTMIVNNRMIIGTLPYAQLKAIFESLLSESGTAGSQRFMENWVDLRPAKKKPAAKSEAKK
jgi:uncharacterized membrane protein/protein-disulfide isomerase